MLTTNPSMPPQPTYEQNVRKFQEDLAKALKSPTPEEKNNEALAPIMRIAFEDIGQLMQKYQGQEQELKDLKIIEAAWEQLKRIEKLHADFLKLYFPNKIYTPEAKQKFEEFANELINYHSETLTKVTNIKSMGDIGAYKGKITQATPLLTQYFAQSLSNLKKEVGDTESFKPLGTILEQKAKEAGAIEKTKARPMVVQEFNGNQITFQNNMNVLTVNIKQYLDKAFKTAKGVDRANIEVVLNFISILEKIRQKHAAFLAAYTAAGNKFSEDVLAKFDDLNAEMQNYFEPYGDFMADYVNLAGKHAVAIQKIIQENLPGKDFDLAKLTAQPMTLAANHLLTVKDIQARTPKDHAEYQSVQTLVGKWENLNKQANDYLAAKDARQAFYKEEIEKDRKFKLKDTKITIHKSVDVSSEQEQAAINGTLLKAVNPKVFKNWLVEPHKTKKGKSAYLIKNERGEPQIKIRIEDNKIIVRQIKGNMISRRSHLQQLDIIHNIVKGFRLGDPLPKTVNSSSDPESMNYLEDKCRVDKVPEYELAEDSLKHIPIAWRLENGKMGDKKTADKLFPEFAGKILVVGVSNPEDIQAKMQSIISKGMIPEIENGEILDKCVAKMQELKALSLEEKRLISEKSSLEKLNPDDKRIEELTQKILSQKEAIKVKSKEIEALKKSINQADFPKNLKLNINTADPVLAIKQYEAVLNTGLTPVLSTKTKEALRVYVKNNPEDVQITVSAPMVEGRISGKMVLERLMQAASDGVLAKISPEAKDAFYQYLQTTEYLTNNTLRCKVDLEPNPIMFIKHFASMGVLVKLSSDESGNKIVKLLQEKLKEPIEIDCSGGVPNLDSAKGDFDAFKDYLENGIEVKVKKQQDMINFVAKQQLPSFVNIQKFPQHKQIELVKSLAKMGVGTSILAPLKGIEVQVSTENVVHAVKLYSNLIRCGFNPAFDDKTKSKVIEYMKDPNRKAADLSVNLDDRDPKDLFEKMKHCFDMGLKVNIIGTDKEKLLSDYIKRNPTLLKDGIVEINGYHPQVLRDNIDLAQRLGMNVQKPSPEIFVLMKKSQTDPIVVKDIEEVKKGGLSSLNVEKTMQRARNLAQTGCKVKLSDTSQKYVDELNKNEPQLKKDAKDRIFFGLFKTAKAKKAESELKELEHYKGFLNDPSRSWPPTVMQSVTSSSGQQGPSTRPLVTHQYSVGLTHDPLKDQAILKLDNIIRGFRELVKDEPSAEQVVKEFELIKQNLNSGKFTVSTAETKIEEKLEDCKESFNEAIKNKAKEYLGREFKLKG